MITIDPKKVTWPAFIKHGHSDELDYVETEAQWKSHYAGGKYLPDDQLIDSAGRCYLPGVPDSVVTQLELDDVLELVRLHASVCGHCCVSKMGAPDVGSAVGMVGVID